MPHLSASQLETFLGCQKKWVARYIEDQKGEPSEHLGLGGAFHSTLEDFGRWRIQRRSGAVDVVALKHQFSQKLRQTLAEQDPHGTLLKVSEGMELRGHAMMEAFARDIAPVFWPVAVEEEFEFEIPRMDRVHGEAWTVVGRVDARTNPSAGPTTIDWKTAGKKWRSGAEWDKIQATLYPLADLALFKTVPSQVTFIVFPTKYNAKSGTYSCEADVRPTTPSMERINVMQHQLRMSAKRISELYESKGAGVEPSPSYLCPYCPKYGNCFAGQSFMNSVGKLDKITVDEDDNPLDETLIEEQEDTSETA